MTRKSSLNNVEASSLKEQVGSFTRSIGEILVDFTALEISTMVVNQIQRDPFEPLEAYANLYEASRGSQERSRQLWKHLQRKYMSCFPDRAKSQPLPNPKQIAEVRTLLKDKHFLRSLRKLAEIQTSQGSEDMNPYATNRDIIYAQTILYIDGDMINRFHADLLHPENEAIRQFIVDAHNQSVTTGTKHWQGMINFMLDFVKSVIGSV